MKPQAHYDAEEKKHMQPYLTPSCIQDRRNAITARHADKTGLISWRSNKYSVPLLYQRSRVGVFEEDGMLRIYDLSSEQVIAEHAICLEKNRVIKNTDHYRDKTLHIEKLESEVQALLSQTTQGEALCAMLKATSPRIYKDQLVGVRKILTQHQKRYGVVAPELMDRLLQFHRLTATGLRDCLQAWHRSDAHADTPAITKKQDGNACLSFYAALHSDTMEQEGSHVDH